VTELSLDDRMELERWWEECRAMPAAVVHGYIEESFALLLGRQTTEKERQNLYLSTSRCAAPTPRRGQRHEEVRRTDDLHRAVSTTENDF
jgi:hypothetical protein